MEMVAGPTEPVLHPGTAVPLEFFRVKLQLVIVLPNALQQNIGFVFGIAWYGGFKGAA